MKINLNFQTDILLYRSDLKRTILAFFLSKKLSYTVISSYLQKLSTLIIAKFTTCGKTDFKLLTSVKQLRAFTMCSAIIPDSRYDDGIFKLSEKVFSPNTMCLDIICVHKMASKSISRCDCRGPQCSSTWHVLNLPFAEQTNSFFLEFAQGF